MILLYGYRMYRALLTSGDHKSADIILNKIPRAWRPETISDEVTVSDTYPTKDLRLGKKLMPKFIKFVHMG